MGHFKHASLSAIVIAGAMALVPTVATAGSYDANTTPCFDKVATIGDAMNAVESAIGAGKFTNSRDQLNMLTKLSAANSKTTVRKWDDAIQKLQDISDTAIALESAAKPKLFDPADAIHKSTLAAQGCMTGL